MMDAEMMDRYLPIVAEIRKNREGLETLTDMEVADGFERVRLCARDIVAEELGGWTFYGGKVSDMDINTLLLEADKLAFVSVCAMGFEWLEDELSKRVKQVKSGVRAQGTRMMSEAMKNIPTNELGEMLGGLNGLRLDLYADTTEYRKNKDLRRYKKDLKAFYEFLERGMQIPPPNPLPEDVKKIKPAIYALHCYLSERTELKIPFRNDGDGLPANDIKKHARKKYPQSLTKAEEPAQMFYKKYREFAISGNIRTTIGKECPDGWYGQLKSISTPEEMEKFNLYLKEKDVPLK